MKICSKCKQAKNREDFYKSGTCADGLRPECKSCLNKIHTARRKKVQLIPKTVVSEKKCSRCNDVKAIHEFHKSSANLDGYRNMCKECRKPESKGRYWSRREEDIAYSKAYRIKNEEKVSAQRKQHYKENRERIRKVQKAYYEANKDVYRRLTRKARSTPHGKLRHTVSTRISRLLQKRGHSKTASIRKSLPYTIGELIAHLEAKFVKDMTWDNYGEWHIDHIKPDSSFEYECETDRGFQESWALENLQPLWAADNLSKGARI